MNRAMAKQKVIELKTQNPSWGPLKIAKTLEINLNFVHKIFKNIFWNCKKTNYDKIKNYKQHPYAIKREKFRSGYSEQDKEKHYFSTKQVIQKIGDVPECQLTGWKLDKNDTEAYQFDHMLSRSNGGTCALDNLQVLCSMANRAKGKGTVDEVIKFAVAVCEKNGYLVTKRVE